MNNDELKKKICDIIAPYVSAWGDDERIADALIAAGIGDVSEWKHRAEVAERALQYACKSILKDRNDTERRVRAYFNAYLERAEKELAELKGGKR